MTRTVTPEQARRAYYVLTATRWLPTGLAAGLFILWASQIGLSTAQALTAMSAIGLSVAVLELPTSGFSDAFGRRPVYVAAAVVQVVAATLYLLADSWTSYLLAGVAMGVFRALESGPLEAWFVDAVHARTPGADVDAPLARAGAVTGASLGAGSLLSGALVLWHPFAGRPALELPMAAFAVGTLGHLAAVVVLMREVPQLEGAWPRLRRSAVATPGVIAGGLRLMRARPALRGLVLAGALTSVVMVVQENLVPVRLAELVGTERAGALMGPAAGLAWGAFALGSAATGALARRVGVARAAMAGRALHVLCTASIALAAGPWVLLALYLVTYGVFGSGTMDRALMHREASADNRATVLSLASMSSFLAFAGAGPLLGVLAERTTTPTAIVGAAMVGALGVPCYLASLRAERGGDQPKTVIV